jgi:hypothetical protein
MINKRIRIMAKWAEAGVEVGTIEIKKKVYDLPAIHPNKIVVKRSPFPRSLMEPQ